MTAVLRTSFFAPFFFVLLWNGRHGSERGLNLADVKRRRFPRGMLRRAFLCLRVSFAWAVEWAGWAGAPRSFPTSPAWPEATSTSPRAKEGTSLQARAANQRRLCRDATFLRPAVTKRRRRRPLRLGPDTPRATSRGRLIHLGPNPGQPWVD